MIDCYLASPSYWISLWLNGLLAFLCAQIDIRLITDLTANTSYITTKTLPFQFPSRALCGLLNINLNIRYDFLSIIEMDVLITLESSDGKMNNNPSE